MSALRMREALHFCKVGKRPTHVIVGRQEKKIIERHIHDFGRFTVSQDVGTIREPVWQDMKVIYADEASRVDVAQIIE